MQPDCLMPFQTGTDCAGLVSSRSYADQSALTGQDMRWLHLWIAATQYWLHLFHPKSHEVQCL